MEGYMDGIDKKSSTNDLPNQSDLGAFLEAAADVSKVGQGHSFRKRRLTYAKNDMQDDIEAAAAAAAACLSEDDEEAINQKESIYQFPETSSKGSSTKRNRDEQLKKDVTYKRARSLPSPSDSSKSCPVAAQSPQARRLRRGSASAEAKSMTHMHMNQGFICRIRQRLVTKLTNQPTSPGSEPTRRASALRRGSNDTTESIEVFRHDHQPFPRDVVGTFSAHGIEPLYEDSDEEDFEIDEGKCNNKSNNSEPTVIAKINQDRGGVAYPYANDWKTALFAAYDGHGDGGEAVSQYCMCEIQKRLEKHPSFDLDLAKAFKETFNAVDESLEDAENIEPLYSGTTACVVLMQGRKLTIANAGDSRAVLARRVAKQQEQVKCVTVNGTEAEITNEKDTDGNITASNEKQIQAIDLSIDQNPDSPGEQERIESCGGFVSPPPEEGLSARVWLDPEFTHIGLAMARSLGDHAVKSVGVISEPVVTYHDLTDDDEFMIIATDGVWEFISSEEAVEIVHKRLSVSSGGGATAACRELIETAAKRWAEHEGDYRDDITAVVVKTNELWRK